MKLRAYLLLANAVSIGFIMILLLAFYRYMLLSKEQFIWLTLATLGAGAVSGLLHFVLVRPLEASLRRVREGARRIAEGELHARVERSGLTEFRELAQQFNKMAESLEASFDQVRAAEAAQRELVANMAHDLRTPLASVQSYVEALEDGVISDEETFRRYLATIRSETVRLGGLIQDLFELSTLDAKRGGKRRLEPAAAEDVLIGLLPSFAKPLESKGLKLRAELPEEPMLLQMEARHLQRIVQNLLENAIRHSPHGGMIVIAAEALNDTTGRRWYRMSVSDEGEGVPEEERERIFERFYRTDRARSRESGGAGLGLAIAKLLAGQYGGDIGVEQVPGNQARGSVFWFTVREADEGGVGDSME